MHQADESECAPAESGPDVEDDRRRWQTHPTEQERDLELNAKARSDRVMYGQSLEAG